MTSLSYEAWELRVSHQTNKDVEVKEVGVIQKYLIEAAQPYAKGHPLLPRSIVVAGFIELAIIY